jgi:anti-sigma factor (TIGR02949 family)
MTCDEVRRLIDLHLDQELPAERAAEVEAHLEACPSCRALTDSRRREREALRAKLQRYAAPAGLDERVVAGLHSAAAPSLMRRWPLGASRLAAALVLGAVLGGGITYHAVRPGAEDLLLHDRLTSHLRSLVSEERMIDMASSDHHTLKPWFAGKVDLSPPVIDLASAGFPLVGGRVDYIAGQRVAVLVYRHGGHVVSVFVEQGAPPAAGVRSERGYNVVGWSEGGLDLRAISDAAPDELVAFARLFREGTRQPADR